MAKKRSSPKVSAKRRSTSVPDSYRGFSLQATRLLYYLLKVDQDDTVSLEFFEDVGVEKPDGKRLAEQDKSYLSANPLTDRSVAFWKTLRNWTDAALLGTLPPDTSHFIAYAPNARMGDIVEAFHGADSTQEAKLALAKARKTLSGNDGDWDISEAAKEHVESVFDADPDVIAAIIAHFTVDATNESPEEALKPLLLERFVGEDSFDLVIRWAHGWVKQQLDCFIERGEPPRIIKKYFHQPLVNFVRTHDRVNILRSVAGTPSDEEVSVERAFRDYVNQLRIIGLDEIDILEAINDFLSASVDRTNWSNQGMISSESLEALEKELTSTWRNKSRRARLAYSDKSDIDQGQITYTDCIEHDARVDGLETPRQFIRGSWHALADDLTVGWHPQYKTALPGLDASTKGGQ